MEEEKNKEFKKETACLFYNFTENNKEIPISAHINIKKYEMNNIYNNINNYYEKAALTEKGQPKKDSYQYYRHIFTKYFSSQLDKTNEKTKPKIKTKTKHLFLTNSKIHFGNFINTNSYIEGYKKLAEYDTIKSKILKSKNFSFIQDPKTIKYKKLPLDLYLSKEDSLKIKDLISVRLIPKKNKNENKQESLIRLTYDNGFFNNPSINFLKNKNNEITNRRIFYINKNKLNEIHNLESLEKKEESHLKEFDNLTSDIEKNEQNKRLAKNKYHIHKNLSELNDIDTNIKPKSILKKQKNYSQTEYGSIYPNTKKILLSQLDKKIKNFKTPKKSLKDFVKSSKHKYDKKIKKLNKLMINANLKPDPKLVINDLKNNKSKINKKHLTKKICLDIKKRDRLLSIVEKLKNIKRIAPMVLLNQIYEEYRKQSKKIIKIDPSKNKINKIYKSSEEGKLIKKKVEQKNNEINKIILKNNMERINLKNKYEKFDLMIEKIKEENKENKLEFDEESDY